MPSGRKELQSFVDKICRCKDMHFTRQQVEKLMHKFDEVAGCQCSKDKLNTKIDRSCFRDCLFKDFKMTDDYLMDRVFRAFDKDSDNLISREEWIVGLSSILSTGDVISEAKKKFIFCAYDLNGDGYISREEMFHLLKNCINRQSNDEDKEEHIKELVEIVLKKADLDHDNRISYTDYSELCIKEPLMIEFLGYCLPDQKRAQEFMEQIDEICIRH